MGIVGPVPMLGLHSDQRQYSREDKVFLASRRLAPGTAILRSKSNRRHVSDSKFIDFQDREPNLKGTATGNSAGSAGTLSTTATQILVTNLEVKIGDILHFSCHDANNSNTNIIEEGENMLVTGKVAVSSTVNLLTVTRSLGTSATYAVSTGVAVNTLEYQVVGSAQKENSTSRTPYSFALNSGFNYTQITSEPYSISRRVKDSKYWGTKDLTREQRTALINMTRKIEGTLWYGIRHAQTLDDGERTYTGGVLWHLSQADSFLGSSVWSTANDLVTGTNKTTPSRIWRPGADFTRRLWEKFVSEAFIMGDSTKVGFVGRDFLRQLKVAYDDQVRLIPKDFYVGGNQNFGITIMEYETQGKRIQFVEAPELGDIGIRDLYLLDLSGVEFVYLKDLWTRKNIQPNDADYEKHDYMIDFGFAMHNMTSHAAILGMSDVATAA